MAENLEHKVRKGGRGILGMAVGLLIGAGVGGYFGAKHELEKGTMYKQGIMNRIKEAAIEGYAWEQEVDPKFYNLERPTLILNPEDMTIHGRVVKLERDKETGEVTDTIDYGKVLYGRIGFTTEDKVEEAAKNIERGFKKSMERLEEGYHHFKDGAKQKFQETFRREDRDREAPDTVYIVR